MQCEVKELGPSHIGSAGGAGNSNLAGLVLEPMLLVTTPCASASPLPNMLLIHS